MIESDAEKIRRLEIENARLEGREGAFKEIAKEIAMAAASGAGGSSARGASGKGGASGGVSSSRTSQLCPSVQDGQSHA